MKTSHWLSVVHACAFSLIASTSHAVSLQNGDIISFTSAGSSVSGIALSGTAFDAAALDSLNGLIIGNAQPTYPDIDQTWTSVDIGATGNHYTTSAVTVIDGSTLDFTGWTMNLFGASGSNYNFGATQNIATYTYDGTNVTVNYSWSAFNDNGNVPLGNLAVTDYSLTLSGTVSSVPIERPTKG